jgi:hypothetical protein
MPLSVLLNHQGKNRNINKMTYQQYYNKLIKDLANSEKKLINQKQLKGEKGYLDQQDLYAYMDLSNDVYSLLSKCEHVLKLIVDGQVNGNDKVDPAVLPGVIDI